MSKDSTTQQDVEQKVEKTDVLEEATQEDAKKEQRSERNSVMDQLAEKRKAQFDKESEESFDDEEVEEVNEEPEKDTMIDLKVDGEIIQKSKSEVDENGGVDVYQMRLAADKRFKEVANEKKRLATYELQLKEKEEALNKSERERLEVSERQSETSDDELATSLANSFYEGDTESVTEKLKKIIAIAKKKDAPLDREAIISEAKFQIQRDEGISEFNKNYAHIKNDKMLFDLTNKRTAELMEERPDLNPKEIILLAAEEVSNKFNPVKKEESQEIKDISDKKDKITNLKSANTRKPSEPEFKPESKDEIFSRYKQNRSR